ncbi:alpha/beta hydrolase [Streptomyces sp. NPDC020858]|uniref:alpha/beta hydrolase n=1 Tax=Streptomyces sp. NPDC020858 TaxID=3365097 RepID=UPI0037875923
MENPLTSLADDAERTRKTVRQVDGPVVLVGHSYGGAVITEAGDLPNVAGLVSIAAFAPDAGESPGQISQELPPAAFESIAPDSDGYLWIKQDKFRESFCQDLGARGRGPGHGGDPEGAAGLDVRRRRDRPGLEEEAGPVPGLHPGPHDPPRQRTPHGPTDEPPQAHRAGREPRLARLPARPGHRPHRDGGRRTHRVGIRSLRP